MVSKVRVDMKLCDRVSEIKATRTDDSFEIAIESQCDEAKAFVTGLGALSLSDLTDSQDFCSFTRELPNA